MHTFGNINDQNTVPHATTYFSVRCSEEEHSAENQELQMLRELPALQSNQEKLSGCGMEVPYGFNLAVHLTEQPQT